MLRLTQIELLGFKSFPHKTVLDLAPGVNCIVGPNGSGKSNIADAIMFAFGTQSPRELRTGNLSGLIFAGTEQIRQLNLASVTLHFERTSEPLAPRDIALGELDDELDEYESSAAAMDQAARQIEAAHPGTHLTRHLPASPPKAYDPTPPVMKQIAELASGDRVSLTRRVFRDGDGGYFINGETVRLKDVDSFFDRYHLGRSAVFSISQGAVERQILASAQEMREWLAEATGIALLLQQKSRAQDKLKRAEANLARLTDIRTHTEQLVADLAGQRALAEQHVRLSAELRTVELSEIRREVEFAQRQLESAGAGLDDVRLRLAESRAELDSLRADDSRVREQRQAAEAETDRLGAELETLRADAERLLREAAVSERSAQASSDALAQATSDEAELGAQVDALATELAASTEQERTAKWAVDELRGVETHSQEQLAAARGAYDQCSAAVEQLGHASFDQARDAAAVHNRIEALSRHREQLAGQLDTGGRYLDALRQRVEASRTELESERTRSGELTAEVTALTARRLQQTDALAGIGAELLGVEQAAAGLHSQIAGLTARHKALGEIEAQDDSGAQILLHNETFQGQLQRATDVRFPPELREAFARVLAQFSGALIGDSGLRAAVLEKLDASETTLLTNLRVPEYSAQSIWPLLEASSATRAALANACGEVLLASSLPDAEALLITAPGASVVLRDGSALIGSAVSQLGRPSPERARQVSLSTDLAQIESQLATTQAQLENMEKARQQLKVRQATTQWERDETAAALAATEARQHAAGELIERLAATLRDRDDELQLLETQRTELTADHARLHEDMPQLEAQLAAIGELQQQIEAQLAAAIARRTEAEAQLERLRTDVAEVITRRQLASQGLAHLQQAGLDLAERLTGLRARREQMAQRIAALESERQTALNTAQQSAIDALQLETRLAESAALLDRVREQRASLEARQAAGQERLTALAAEISRYEQDDVALEAQRQRATERIEEWLADLRERFHMTLSQLIQSAGGTGAPARGNYTEQDFTGEGARATDFTEAGRYKLREEKARLREALDALGAVNLLSIEQHSQHSQRLDFLTRQNADLARAVEDLTALVGSLDSRTEEQYRGALGQIGERFNAMYVQLFGEGWARLRFEDPAAVIDSGVEVEVQLPGGRRHSLRSLSGGQRSLIFLALFFAVHSVRSPGFCILDEADAALDDANVARFVKLIQSFGQQHDGHAAEQFIVVTHNKLTMEIADKLVGVVGRPKGVSNLLEVDLRDARKMSERVA